MVEEELKFEGLEKLEEELILMIWKKKKMWNMAHKIITMTMMIILGKRMRTRL